MHDASFVSRKKTKPGNPRPRPVDDEALRDAYADVKPLRDAAPRRASAPPPERPLPHTRASASAPRALELEREGNGLVTARRPATHSSILDSLEDPRLEVDAEYDLHGLTAHEAEREVLIFVREQQRIGNRWVLVIVGKGLHSRDGKGTLREHIIGALSSREPARYVLAFRTAPRHLGGSGALAVRLVDRL